MNFFTSIINYISFISINNCIPMTFNRNLKVSIINKFDIKKNWRSLVNNWTLMTLPFSTYYFHFGLVFFINWKFILLKLLIFWLYHFSIRLKIKPKLKSIRIFIKWSWHLCMNYSSTCRHPLYISWSDNTFMSFKILMINFSFQHIGNCLKTSMRMIWKSSW